MRNGMDGEMRSVGNGERELVHRLDVTVVKSAHAADHEGRSNVIEEEAMFHRHITDHALTSQWNDFDAQVNGRTTGRDVPCKLSHTVVEEGGRCVFRAVHEEANERLPRTRRAFIGSFKTQHDFNNDQLA